MCAKVEKMNHGEKVIVARHSAFQSIRLTEDASGLRTLRFGEGASQSTVKADDPRHLEMRYTRLLPAGLAFSTDPRRVLMVGLGGGALPRFLHSHFPELTIDVVELDGDVVEVAREHCGFVEDATLRVSVEDGRDFIERSEAGGYDVIILDSYGADSIPAHLTTLEFLGAVRKALAADGIVIANVWGKSVNPLYAHMLRTYQAAFEAVYILDVPARGTKLFVALPGEREAMTRDAFIARAREISRARGFAYALEETVAGFRNATQETIQGGEVLRD